MKFFTPLKNQHGQLGVFVGMSILVIISLLAFVINVGLFVKAKINLQNAVDAAAYAGAATQARRLTNIGYLNWEMRNTMKEWMFKYYILGNIGNSKVRNNSIGDPLDFRPKPFSATAAANENAFAKFNIPRNCINFGSSHNICNVYGVPGVPRFPSIGTPGSAELTKEFTDQAVSIKSKNCVDRSVLNFSTTLLWTFGKGGNSSGLNDAPQLLGHRVGAWPQTLEYAIRMRNLEYLVNRPPVVEGICASEGAGCISLSELKAASGNTPLNERPIAAFETAFRNLGGGSSSVSGGADHLSIKSTFKLTELAPNPMPFEKKSLSGFLIPEGHTYPGSSDYSKKHYLDLKILPINYMIFYTTFVPSDENFNAEIRSEGACASSITGIPVPFYITGFFKNPEVLTYYAVKGEAKYVGLFYPFDKDDGLTMRAYAAAKPMGGRIGPILFEVDGNSIKPRSDDKTRTRGFANAVVVRSGEDPTWEKGLPIPFDKDNNVYMKDHTQVTGGVPGNDEKILFSIPNMIYDFIPGTEISGSDFVDVIKRSPNSPISSSLAGLYDSNQFHSLKSGLTTSNPSPEHIEGKIIEARRATRFDALNYLIPTHNNEVTNNEAPSVVQGDTQSIGGVNFKRYSLYAPLCDDESIFPYQCKAGSDLGNAIKEFLTNSSTALNQYLEELANIADGMRNQPATDGGGSNYVAAANSLHPDSPAMTTESNISVYDGDENCRTTASLAEKFAIFFNTNVDASSEDVQTFCGVTPLLFIATSYIMGKNSNESQRNFIQPEYYTGGKLPDNLHSAFHATERKGAPTGGEIQHPFFGSPEASGKRNFYSTKLFSIKKILNAADPTSYNDLFPYAEQYSGGSLRNGADPSIVGGESNIVNILNPSSLSEFGDFKDTF